MTPADATPPAADGILRCVSDRTWEGSLHGYRVQVFWCGGTWCYAVINPQGHTEVCPRVASFAEGARRAREWIERRRVVQSGYVRGGLGRGEPRSRQFGGPRNGTQTGNET